MRTQETLKQRIKRTLHIKRAISIVWQSGPGWVIATLSLLVIQSLLPLAQLYLMKLVVDAVAESIASDTQENPFTHIAFLICLMGAVALVTALCRVVSNLVNEAQAIAVTDHVHNILHNKSIEVDLEYYENADYYDTLHRAQEQAPYRPTRIVNGLVSICQNGISLLAMAGLLFAFHWSVPLVLFAASLPGLLVRLKYAGRMYRWRKERTPLERLAYYFHALMTHNGVAKELRLFNLGGYLKNKYKGLRTQLRHERLKISKRRSIADSVTQTSTTLAVFGAYAFIAYRTVNGVISIGDLVMYFQAFQRGQTFLQQSMSALSGLYEDNLFLSHLSEFLRIKPKVTAPRDPKPMPRPIQSGITFDKVNFNYPTGTRETLKEISLSIKPGEHVALVGENGSGKTTLIKLMCRLYDPTDGSIRIDGCDLKEFNTHTLRREIGVVLQDYMQYFLSAKDNIRFGDLDLDPKLTDEKVREAAEQSGIHSVIADLPKGYDTTLGKWFEDGEELSIGEWQKVALARAYLRSAQVLILDEPTSSMDAKAEYEVFKRFTELTQGKTTVLISHRLSTVRMADRIFVLDQGKIVESGTHDELIQKDGKYKRLFEIQAKNYLNSRD